MSDIKTHDAAPPEGHSGGAGGLHSWSGGEILAVKSEQGEHVVIKPLCESIGIDANGQVQRLKRQGWAQGACMMHVPTAGGAQEMFCLPRNRVGMWLVTLDASRYFSAKAATPCRQQWAVPPSGSSTGEGPPPVFGPRPAPWYLWSYVSDAEAQERPVAARTRQATGTEEGARLVQRGPRRGGLRAGPGERSRQRSAPTLHGPKGHALAALCIPFKFSFSTANNFFVCQEISTKDTGVEAGACHRGSAEVMSVTGGGPGVRCLQPPNSPTGRGPVSLELRHEH